METSFWAECLKVSHSLHGSGCVGLWACLQLLQKETPLMTARMSLGPFCCFVFSFCVSRTVIFSLTLEVPGLSGSMFLNIQPVLGMGSIL